MRRDGAVWTCLRACHPRRRSTRVSQHLCDAGTASQPTTGVSRLYRLPGGACVFFGDSEPCLFLLLVRHLTPRGGVLADKKGLQGRLHLLPKHGTLLIGLHGLKRVPHADGTAAVRIVDIVGQPPPSQAGDLFICHSRPIGLLILLPTAGPQFPPGYAHHHPSSSYDCAAPAAREAERSTPRLHSPTVLVLLYDAPGGALPATRGRAAPVTAPAD
jgi:hypothetical protein